MAIVKLELSGKPVDGQHVTFKAPCDCTAVTGLRTYYAENNERKSMTFTMKDAHNNDLTGIGNLFGEGSLVEAVLNVTDKVVYLLNAATNGYLEAKIPKTASDVGALPIGTHLRNADLNTVTKAGVYYLNETTTNIPTWDGIGSGEVEHSILVVYLENTCIVQKLTITNAIGYPTHANKTFIRVCAFGDTWSEWKQFGFADEFLPLTGGNISGSLGVNGGTGGIQSSGADLQLVSHRKDRTGYRLVSIINSEAQPTLSHGVLLYDILNGVVNPYILYGEHNITCGTSALTSGSSALTTGCIYQQIE